MVEMLGTYLGVALGLADAVARLVLVGCHLRYHELNWLCFDRKIKITCEHELDLVGRFLSGEEGHLLSSLNSALVDLPDKKRTSFI